MEPIPANEANLSMEFEESNNDLAYLTYHEVNRSCTFDDSLPYEHGGSTPISEHLLTIMIGRNVTHRRAKSEL